MIPTCVLGGVMGHKWGRKHALLTISPIFSMGFLCQAFAQDVVMLIFGRFLTGCASGLACGPTAVYVSEIATPKLRTTLGAGISGSYNVGMVLIFSLGAFCHWRVLAGVSALFPCLGFLAMLFIPESPAWLHIEGDVEGTKKALKWFMPKNGGCPDDEFEHLTSDMFLEQVQNNEKSRSHEVRGWRNRWSQLPLARREIWRPLLVVMSLFALQQASGMSALSYYAVNIFQGAGSSINEYVATIIFGLTRLVSQILGSFLLIRFKRLHLLTISCAFVSMGFCILATSAYLNNKALGQSSLDVDGHSGDFSLLGVLPLIGVMSVALAYHIGLGPIPWSYTAELFPVDVRSFMSGVCNCIGNTYIFITVKSFPSLIDALRFPNLPNGGGPAGAFWLFSGISLLTIVYAALFLPETKGKTFEEISRGFQKTNKRKRHSEASIVLNL
ncbi:facilitated trehalose transporter Tret1-2 homolog isoform X2 [Tigriopus californicus]|nr:facilitated trehalose transporter Tret1-2 homolog isoform X2 [Tigriopus californicus]